MDDVAAVWVPARLCPLASVVAAVQDQKANRALDTLYLSHNNVGDAGAAALGEALKATVLTCSQERSGHVPVVTKDVTTHGGANSWRRPVVAKGALRLLCLSCHLKISIHLCVWFLKLIWPGSRIDWVGGDLSCTRRAPHEHLPSCGTPPHHVIRAARAPCE